MKIKKLKIEGLRKRRRLFVFAFTLPILLLIAGITFFALRNASPALAAWFDDAWAYRTKYPITNSSGSTQTDFQTMLTVDTATLISAGKMLSTCNDVRITDINGKTMPIWIEPTTCNTASTKIWAKVPNIYTSGSDIYLYYGNPTASAASSTSSTFIRDIASAAVSWPLDDTTTTQSYSRVTNPALATGRNILIDSDMETSGTTNWSAVVAGTVSKQTTSPHGGTQVLRVAHSGANNNPRYGQSILVATKAYRITGYARSDGNATPTVLTVNTTVWTGTTSTSWQAFDITVTMPTNSSSGVNFGATTSTSGQYTEFDDINIYQLNVPDFSATPTQIITDGNMETAGVGPWVSGNGATLTKEVTSPHGGSQLLRVARNTTNNPQAQKNSTLTTDSVYRITGYMRSDGNATPLVAINGGTSISGTTSTAWQPFDFVGVAPAAGSGIVYLRATTSTGNQYVEFDDVVVSLDTGIRQGELTIDGNMEASGTTNWFAVNSATVTKDTSAPNGGTQNIRVARNAVNNPYVQQVLLVPGKTYRITGYMKSDGTSQPRALLGTSAAVGQTGTTSTSWQAIDFTGVAADTFFALQALTTTGTSYADFDDISVTEINPLVGRPTNGVVLGSSTGAGGHLTNAYTFDGVNDFVNLYSSDLNSTINPNEGSLIAWAKFTGTWGNGVNAYLIRIGNSERAVIYKSATNTLTASYLAGGVTSSVNVTTSTASWFQVALTWSKSSDQMKVYFNGAQSGSTQTGLGTWSSNLDSSNVVIGSANTTPILPWSGMINDVRLYSRALSPAEIADQYSASYDVQAYTTSNYLGQELLRKYNASVTLGSPATEERGGAPLAYWRLDEGNGTVTNDQTPNASSGTLTGIASPATATSGWQTEDKCISGKCLAFDGSNDSVSAGANSKFDFGTNDFTISVWIRPNSYTGNKNILSKGDYGVAGYVLWMDSSGGLNFRTQDSGGGAGFATSAGAITLNQWQHIVVSISRSGTSKIYINGNAVATSGTVRPGSLTSGAYNFQFGGTNSGMTYYQGYIDDVKIYGYARTAAQAKTDYLSRGTNEGTSAVLSSLNSSLSTGLVGYWKLDETATPSLDASGNSNSGTWTGNTAVALGRFGSSATFDGTGDYLTLTSFPSTTTALTYSAWVNISDISNPLGVISTNGSILRVSSTGINWYPDRNQSPVTATYTFTTNTWYHIIVTQDGTNYKIFLNGTLLGSGTASALDSSNVNKFIGTYQAGTWNFNGKIDEVRIYNRAISAQEARSLYGFAPGPVGYWKMDEKTGTSTADNSGNALTGTLSSGPAWTQGKFGSAIDFNQTTTNVVTVSDNDLLDVPTTKSITITGWFKRAGSSLNTTYLFKKMTGGAVGYRLYFNGGNTLIALFSDGTHGVTLTSPTTYTDTNWHSFALVMDRSSNTNTALYIDGVPIRTATAASMDIATVGDTSTTQNLQIGYGFASSENFNGSLDDFKIYNYARTQQQIVEDLQGGRSDTTLTGSVLPRPIGYWNFDEGQGTTSNSTGIDTTLTGTLTNMSAPATGTSGWNPVGKMGKALTFDGSNDYVNMGTNSSLNVIGGDFSISTWAKTTQTGSSLFIMQKGSGPANPSDKGYGFCLCNSGSTWTFAIYGSGTSLFPSSPTSMVVTNTWTHLTGVYIAATKTAYIYVNGKLAGSQTNLTFTVPDISANNFVIGGSGVASTLWQGSIDEVKVYNSALSQDQVMQDYNAGAALVLGSVNNATESATLSDGAGAPPVIYWNFDEKTGTLAKDTLGNNVTGTLGLLGSAVPQWTQGKFGSALFFTARSDTAGSSVGYNTAINPLGTTTGNAATISMWLKPNPTQTNAASDAFVMRNGTGTDQNFGISIRNLSGAYSLRTSYYDGVTFRTVSSTSTTLVPPSQWTHVEVVITQGTNIKYYINGKFVETLAWQGSNSVLSTTSFNVGGHTGASGQSYDGVIDDVKVYNYARTQSQISYDYNRGLPVGWWRFDECQGTSANDSSGNGNTGTITIGATGTQSSAGTCNTTSTAWGNGATGKYNASLNFDGTDDYVSVGNPAALQITGSITVSAWVKIGATGNYRTILSKNGASGSFGYFIATDNVDRPYFNISANGTANSASPSSPTAIDTTAWHHIVGTYDGVNAKLYVDGTQRGTTPYSSGIFATTSNVVIGNMDNNTTRFQGQIDDARIYNYSLSPAQIRQIYNDGASVFFGPSQGSP